MWFERFRCQTKENEATINLRAKELNAEWYARCEEKTKQIYDLKAEVLLERNSRTKIEEKLNIRGALGNQLLYKYYLE